MARRPDNCYGPDGKPLEPNPADDGSFPEPQHDVPPPPDPVPTGNEIIRDALDAEGRCYGPQPPPIPPSRGDLAPEKFEEPEPEEELTPNAVIRELIGRCYPDIAPTTLGEYIPPDLPDNEFTFRITEWIDWVCDFFPDIPFCRDGSGISIDLRTPDPRQPNWPYYDPSQCALIKEFKEKNEVEPLPERGPGWWKHKVTGKVYFCDQDREGNTDWEPCVRDTLECIFRPFATGTWKPPKGDCEAFHPRGWSGNKDEICIKNCFPERLPIYEAKKGSNLGLPMLKPFSDENHNDTIVTINAAGNWNGKKLFSTHGNKYFNSATTITHSFDGFTVNVTPIDDEGEWDSEWWISGSPDPLSLVPGTEYTSTFNGGKSNVTVKITIVGGGKGRDTWYGYSNVPGEVPAAPFGYVLTSTTPAFYVLKEEANGSVPLFKFYSNTTDDTFLTTNPGMPDSSGTGERETMDAAGMGSGSIIGYVFSDSSKALPYLGEGEQIHELHRYYAGFTNDPTDNDHKYSVNALGYAQRPTLDPNKQLYRVPVGIDMPLCIFYDVQKGNAGYENTWGVYLAGENREPVWGQVILANATDSVGYGELVVSSTILSQYENGYIGFFLVPNGNNNNSVSNGDLVTFSETGNGWRSNLNSSQSNLTIFSDRELNWNKKEFVRYDTSNYQWWEDLLAGDEDYDDFKGFYRLQFGAGAYFYEGVACHVYKDAGPAPVMMKIKARTSCDPRVFEKSFEDATVIRTDCGSVTKSNKYDVSNYECGPCSGEYSVQTNKTQTIKIVRPCTMQLRSFGSITSSVQSEGMKFKLRAKKNGTQVWEETYVHRDWPSVGNVLMDSVTFATNDTFTFEVVEIITGNFQSANQVTITCFDAVDEIFDHNFVLHLGTTQNDTVGQPTTATITSNPTADQITGGAVTGFNMEAEYKHRGAAASDEYVWSYFSGRHDLGGLGNSDSTNYVRAPIWRADISGNPARNAIMQVSTEGPDINGDDSAFAMFYADGRIITQGNQRYGGIWIEEADTPDRVNVYNPDNIEKGNSAVRRVFGFGGFLVSYGDTGKHMGTSSQDELSFPTFATSRIECKPMPFFGEYREFDRGLFGWWADFPQPPPASDGVDYGGSFNAETTTVNGLYAAVEDCGMMAGALATTQAYTNFHPDAWFCDYYLRNEHSPIGDGKIRVMFMPVAQNLEKSGRTHEKQLCWIEVVEVLDQGSNYRSGDVFEFSFPPHRDSSIENAANTPFFPDQENDFNMPTRWEYHTKVYGTVNDDEMSNRSFDAGQNDKRQQRLSFPKRTPIEPIYQESHNKDSKVWFWCSTKEEDRIKFRVQIHSTNPATDDATIRYTVQADIDEFNSPYN